MRDAQNMSATKASDQRWFAIRTRGIGVRVPRARLRPRRRLTDNPSSRESRYSFFRVHQHACALQNQTDPPIAEPAAHSRDLLHGFADIRIVGRPLSPYRLRIDTDQNAGPAL